MLNLARNEVFVGDLAGDDESDKYEWKLSLLLLNSQIVANMEIFVGVQNPENKVWI